MKVSIDPFACKLENKFFWLDSVFVVRISKLLAETADAHSENHDSFDEFIELDNL